jgi:hypothetical protein
MKKLHIKLLTLNLSSLRVTRVHISRVDPRKGIRVLRQCTVPRTELMFVTIQRENIRPSKKEINKVVTMLKLSDVCS